MPFMQYEITERQEWVRYEDEDGSTNFCPRGYYEKEKGHKNRRNIKGFGARLSAPGYMDCTDWAVFNTEEEAKAYLEEMYPEDDEEAEPEPGYEDVVEQDKGSLGSVTTWTYEGKSYTDKADLKRAIGENYFPQAYRISDHGNVTAFPLNDIFEEDEAEPTEPEDDEDPCGCGGLCCNRPEESRIVTPANVTVKYTKLPGESSFTVTGEIEIEDKPGFAIRLNYLGIGQARIILEATECLYRSRTLTEDEKTNLFYIRSQILDGIEYKKADPLRVFAS